MSFLHFSLDKFQQGHYIKSITTTNKEVMMKVFVLERGVDGEVYAYFENATHHTVVNHNPYSGRSLEDRVEINTENECLVKELMAPGQWTSFILRDYTNFFEDND